MTIVVLPILVGLAVAVAAPRAIVRAAAALFPGCIYDALPHAPIAPAAGAAAGARTRARIALTIDDAPDSATTPAILDTLRAHGARATFFVITAQLAGADSILARMRREGHEIGNHFTLDRPSILLDSASFDRDLAAADSALRRFAPVRWARPGSGWYTPRMVRAIERAGQRCALGSVYPLDGTVGWRRFSEWYVLRHADPGAIVVLHDRGDRGRRTAAALGRILPGLRARGYDVVTLSQLVDSIGPSTRTDTLSIR